MELQWTHKVSITQQVYLVKNVLEGRKEYNSSVFMSWKWGKEFWIEKNPYFLSICFRFFSFICLIDLFGDVLSCIKSRLTCCSYCKAFQRQLISMCFAPGDEHRHKKPQGFRDWVFLPEFSRNLPTRLQCRYEEYLANKHFKMRYLHSVLPQNCMF